MHTSISVHFATSIEIADVQYESTTRQAGNFVLRNIKVHTPTGILEIDIYPAEGSELDVDARAALAREPEQPKQVAA